MKKPDITPGPWYIPKGHSTIVEWEDSQGWGCTIAETDGGSVPDVEQCENARAIAAVPDLLAALEDCRESLLRLPDKELKAFRITCIQQAEAALTKAGYTF